MSLLKNVPLLSWFRAFFNCHYIIRRHRRNGNKDPVKERIAKKDAEADKGNGANKDYVFVNFLRNEFFAFGYSIRGCTVPDEIR
jgi:hypothetical protein